MAISFAGIVILCLVSASALGVSIVMASFLLMWCGCCRVSDDSDRDERGNRVPAQELVVVSDEAGTPAQPERKGIPLNSKPPRLTPEQEKLRDEAMEKYKRRKARNERRQARAAAREARAARQREEREGDDQCDDENGHSQHRHHHYENDDEDDDGYTSVTSRTTLTSAATTVRTASTAAYGRGAYLLPPPRLCGADMNERSDDDDEDVRSHYSRSSRRSTGSGKSKASQGTLATVKNYMRHRQRQRLRRREEQQQVELFNQWAEAQMTASSELSPSSKSSAASADEGTHKQHQQQQQQHSMRPARSGRSTGGGAGGGHPVKSTPHHHPQLPQQNHTFSVLDTSLNGSHTYWQPQRRSGSVASSAPRPPEEILGVDPQQYTFLSDPHNTNARGYREQEHLQAGFLTSPNNLGGHVDFRFPAELSHSGFVDRLYDDHDAPVPASSSRAQATGEAHVDPRVREPVHLHDQPPPPPSTRRPKRTWKAVEHNAALSGFFNTPANNSFGPLDASYDDGEAPAPFRGPSGEPPHSPVQYPKQPRE